MGGWSPGSWPGRCGDALPSAQRSGVLYTVLYMASLRTQIYLTEAQRAALDDITRSESRSLAEVIRDAVDRYLQLRSADPSPALDETFGALPDLEIPSRDEWDRG